MKAAQKKPKPRIQPPRPQALNVPLAGSFLIRFGLPLSIFVLTFVAFSPTLQNGFLNWDDEAILLDNPHYRGLSWSHIRWMFTTFHMSVYRPIAWLTMGLDYILWGMEPFGYHLTSLLFHCANAVLFYFVARRLLRLYMPTAASNLVLPMAAGFAALFFSLHPLRVEPVAWESGEDNLVAGFFFMLSLLCYLKATASVGWGWMAGSVSCYGLSILSKALTVPLPLGLLVLDVYPLRRLNGDPRTWVERENRRTLWEKVPFLLLAVPVAIVAVLAKQSTGAVNLSAKISWVDRLMQSLYGLAFYLWKTIIPLGLSPLYERPLPFDPWAWPFLLSGVIVLAVTGCLGWLRHRWPGGLAAWVYYGAILLPTLGVITYGPQIVGDRYSYFPCLGWAVLAGAGVLYLWKSKADGRIQPAVFVSANALAVAFLIVLSVLSWQQTKIWHDSEKLWTYALALDQRSSFAHNNLGLVLAKRGALAEAIVEVRKAVEIDPASVESYTNLANFLAQQGSSKEAIAYLRRALEIDPNFASAHNTLGNVLADSGALDEAIEHFRQALGIDADSAMTHYNLARALAKRGDFAEALKEYRTALRINPTDPDIHNNLGLLLANRGSPDEAIQQFGEAVRVDPGYAKAYFNLGKIFAQQGRLDDAVKNFQQAVRLDPEVAEIHENLARVFARQGNKEKAMEEYQKALALLQARSNRGSISRDETDRKS